MPQEDITPQRKILPLPLEKRLPFEPRERAAEVIDPKDPEAKRKFELQRRGGAYSDRIKTRWKKRRSTRA